MWSAAARGSARGRHDRLESRPACGASRPGARGTVGSGCDVADVVEDLADHAGIEDEGNDLHFRAAAGAAQALRRSRREGDSLTGSLSAGCAACPWELARALARAERVRLE
jgi:hypothetical protein